MAGKMRGGLTREQRLAVAPKRHFMQSPDLIYRIRRYAKWFYLKPETAIEELRLLGVVITPKDVKAFKQSAATIKQAKLERRERLKYEKEHVLALLENSDSDEDFAFIAGYTSWGFPYGVTWEEQEELERI
ncbi:MAG: hypothetical protein WCV67_08975 [Victivallaceae bacterium]|jgi:hypothetical protein